MLYQHFTSKASDGDALAVVTATTKTTWRELGELTRRRFRELPKLAGQRAALPLPANADGLATLAALDGHNCDVFLLDSLLSNEQIGLLTEGMGLNALVHVPKPSSLSDELEIERLSNSQEVSNEPQPARVPAVTILTSGTEGRPKAARHSWESLARPVRRLDPSKNAHQTWLLSYRVQLYAGLQVALQAILNFGTLVIPQPGASPDEVVNLMAVSNVEYASATPSYWRRLVMFANRKQLCSIPLKQITLGGEASDQQILDGLADVFPDCRIVHIYATTELGRCFSVADGKAGFPLDYLSKPSEKVPIDRRAEIKIEDGELYVRSANRMHGYDSSAGGGIGVDSDDWYATGDLVEIREDRVHFLGRAGEMINVGGNKVQPLVVEDVIRSLQGVADVRVFAKSSSIAGQLVACEFVVESCHDPDTVRQSIAEACAASLATYQRPRFLTHVEEIKLSAAGKSKRAD